MTIHEKGMPIIIGNSNPFRLVLRKNDSWEPSIDEINSNTFDHLMLNRTSFFVKTDNIKPFNLGIGFDGSLILPAFSLFKDKSKILEVLNTCLCNLLMGGVFCEALLPGNISSGIMYKTGYYRHFGDGKGQISNLHSSIRNKMGGSIQNIALWNPERITEIEFKTAFMNGQEILAVFGDSFSPNILMNGVTHYVQENWAESLVMLWTSIEQIISFIWKSEIIGKRFKDGETPIKGRKKNLKDFRTWTVSAKNELLFQKEYFSREIYSGLNTARKARNDFAHSAKVVEKNVVDCALEIMFKMISLVISSFRNDVNLNHVIQMIQNKHCSNNEEISEPMTIDEFNEKYSEKRVYIKIPSLPGDSTWNEEDEFERIESLLLDFSLLDTDINGEV